MISDDNKDIDDILECLEKQGYKTKLSKEELKAIIEKYMDKNEDEVCIDIKNEFNSEMNKEINDYLENNDHNDDYLENNHDYDDCLEKKDDNEIMDCENNIDNQENIEDLKQEPENDDIKNDDFGDDNITNAYLDKLNELLSMTNEKLNEEILNKMNDLPKINKSHINNLTDIKNNKSDDNMFEKYKNKKSPLIRPLLTPTMPPPPPPPMRPPPTRYSSPYRYESSVDRYDNLYNRYSSPYLNRKDNRFDSPYRSNINRNENRFSSPYRTNVNRNENRFNSPYRSVFNRNDNVDKYQSFDRFSADRLIEERMMMEERIMEEQRIIEEQRIMEEQRLFEEQRLLDDRKLLDEQRKKDDRKIYDSPLLGNKPIVKDYIYIQGENKPIELLGDELLNEIDGLKNDIITYEIRDPKMTLRNIFDKFKENKKSSMKYDKDEKLYYESLEANKKAKIDKLEDKISKLNNIIVPLRFRVLESNLPLHNKALIINKIEDLFSNKLMGGSEITKYSNWVNSALKIPFKKYKKLPLDITSSNNEDIGNYLVDVKKTLDTAVYGHTKTKEQIIQIIAQWITNPSSTGNCIGIEGVMGNGKTTLVKNGIAKAIDRPFAFITLGGCSDASFLEGHNYTYEGSMWGKIVDVLIQCKCMNPVFYFDELDKVSETPKGEEIINTLIHLTDSSQNSQFSDKYFNGIPLDLSKSLFIFSYNDKTKINPILLDRLICIKTDDFKTEDKIEIAKNYLLKEIFDQLTIDKENYNISNENLEYIIENYTDEGGVRTLKKHLFSIFSKLNLLKLTKHDDNIKYTFDLDEKLLENNEINKKIIDLLIGSNDKETDEYYKTFYM